MVDFVPARYTTPKSIIFDGVVIHYEDVAWLEIAVNQPSLMRGLQTFAHLGNDLHNPPQSKPRAGMGDQFSQGLTLQQRHHEERFLMPVFLDDVDVADLNNVGVRHLRQSPPFLGEELYRVGVGNVPNYLNGDGTSGLGVEGAPNDTHAAFTQLLLQFVTSSNLRQRHGTSRRESSSDSPRKQM